MKTIETLTAILTASREEYRATATAARQAVRDLETVYRETIEGTPAETVAAYVERVGYDVAVSTIATLVNRSASDGRISRRCAEWAAAQEEAFDAEAAERLWLYSDRIHKAHLDQLAAAMMEYKPEEPTEEPTEEPAETFPCLRTALTADHANRADLLTFYVEHGYMPTWAEENRKTPDAGLQRWSTPAKWAAYQAGTLARDKAVKLATARALRDLEKTHAARLAKLDRISAAPDLEFITINMEWKRNRTWGYNPTATAVTNEAETYTGTASGCGYDKGSTAVADALNASPAVLKALYTAAENALAAGQTFTRYENGNVTWRDILGYGSGYSILPYFEGGVGVSCFETIFSRCGYRFRLVASGKRFDAYTVTRKEAE